MVKKGAFTEKELWPGTISERHYSMFDRDVNTVELLNIPGFSI